MVIYYQILRFWGESKALAQLYWCVQPLRSMFTFQLLRAYEWFYSQNFSSTTLYLSQFPACRWVGEEGEERIQNMFPWETPVVVMNEIKKLPALLVVFPSTDCAHPTHQLHPWHIEFQLRILSMDTWGGMLKNFYKLRSNSITATSAITSCLFTHLQSS